MGSSARLVRGSLRRTLPLASETCVSTSPTLSQTRCTMRETSSTGRTPLSKCFALSHLLRVVSEVGESVAVIPTIGTSMLRIFISIVSRTHPREASPIMCSSSTTTTPSSSSRPFLSKRLSSIFALSSVATTQHGHPLRPDARDSWRPSSLFAPPRSAITLISPPAQTRRSHSVRSSTRQRYGTTKSAALWRSTSDFSMITSATSVLPALVGAVKRKF